MEAVLNIESFIRKSISEEQEAISAYLSRIEIAHQIKEESGDEGFRKKLDDLVATLEDIISEEEVHVGQLREMLKLFDISDEQEIKGEEEAQELIGESFLAVASRLRKYIKEN